MLRIAKGAEASVHDTRLSQLIFEALLYACRQTACKRALSAAVAEPKGLQHTTHEVRRSQHLSDRERRHGRMRCNHFFRTPACLVAHRAHALRSELDEHAMRKMGQAWLLYRSAIIRAVGPVPPRSVATAVARQTGPSTTRPARAT